MVWVVLAMMFALVITLGIDEVNTQYKVSRIINDSEVDE